MNTLRVVLCIFLFFIQMVSVFAGVSWIVNIVEQDLQLSAPQLNSFRYRSTESVKNDSREFLLGNVPPQFVDFNFKEKTVHLIWNRESLQKGELELITVKRLENQEISISKLVAIINFPQPIQELHKCEVKRKWFGKVSKSCMILKEPRAVNERDLQRIEKELERRIKDSNEFQEIIHSSSVMVLV